MMLIPHSSSLAAYLFHYFHSTTLLVRLRTAFAGFAQLFGSCLGRPESKYRSDTYFCDPH